MSTSLNSLSPELVNQIFVQTLDYSIFVNNRQLKKISLVCKRWSQIARRLMVREVHITDQNVLTGLFRLLGNDPTLRWLIRSITFGSPGSPVATQDDDGVSGDSDLLALAELCTKYEIDRPTFRPLTPTSRPEFPRSNRLLRIQYPIILDKYGEPRSSEGALEPSAAIDALVSAPSTITHLVIDGSDMTEFATAEHDPTRFRPNHFTNLTSLALSNLVINPMWLSALLSPSTAPSTLRKLRLINVGNSELTSRLLHVKEANRRIQEFIWYDGMVPVSNSARAVVSNFESLTHLGYNWKSSRLCRKIPLYFYELPRTLRQITLVVGELFPNAYRIIRHLATANRHDVRSITIEVHSNPLQPRSFPELPVRPLDSPQTDKGGGGGGGYRTTSTVEQLRISISKVEPQNLCDILSLLGHNLRYLAIDGIDCLPPFDIIRSSCQGLRWLELGSIQNVWDEVNNGPYDEDVWWDDEDVTIDDARGPSE